MFNGLIFPKINHDDLKSEYFLASFNIVKRSVFSFVVIGNVLILPFVFGDENDQVLPFILVVRVFVIFIQLFSKSISFQVKAKHSPILNPKKYSISKKT